MQLTADIFGMNASRAGVEDTSGLGAAICASVGLGLHPDFGTAVRAMTRPGRTFEPSPAASARYEQLYREVYLRMYPRLRPLYERLRHLTRPG
jgi:sugar (pentulose or hexulose) kinase